MQNLAQQLAKWDERDTQLLEGIYKKIKQEKDFPDNLIPLFQEERTVQGAATWLYKHHIDQGNKISKAASQKIMKTLKHLEGWPSKLHILQLLAAMPLDEEQIELLLPFLDIEIGNKTKFVKAWAYNGYAIVAKILPTFLSEVEAIYLQAYETESASTKARIRKAIKENKLPISLTTD